MEGLAAYANEDVPEALLAAAAPAGGAPPGAGNPGMDPGWAAPDPAVAGVLRELGRVAAHRHLPAVKDWLRVLVKVPSKFIQGHYRMCTASELRERCLPGLPAKDVLCPQLLDMLRDSAHALGGQNLALRYPCHSSGQ